MPEHPHNEPDQPLTLLVTGMHCGSCVAAVERALKAVPGVQSPDVNFATERATLRAPRTVIEAAIEAIRDAGFDAKLESAPDAFPATDTPEPTAGEEAAPARRDEAAFWRPRALAGLALAAPVMALGMFVPGTASGVVQLALTAILQLWLGSAFLSRAWQSLTHRRADMDTLVSIGTLAAFAYSCYTLAVGHDHFYFDTAATILALIALGRWLEARAKSSARRAIEALMDLAPPTAVVLDQGREIERPLAEVRQGDTLLIRPGGRIPVDGTILTGRGVVDESMLTGEPLPADRLPGQTVHAGTINTTGSFTLRADKLGKDALLGQIAAAVDAAQTTKSNAQRLADRVAGIFVPIVLLVALGTLIAWALAGRWEHGLHAAIAVLIVACPCALGLATPMAIMVGTAVGARRGILIKDASVLERVGTLDTIILDKTGTLTKGRPTLVHIETVAADTGNALHLAAGVESRSEHPIARAIVAKAKSDGLAVPTPTDFRADVGSGAEGTIDGRRYRVERADAPASTPHAAATWVQLVELSPTRPVLARFAIADEVRDNAAEAIATVHAAGLRTILLSGDNSAAVEAVARATGIEEWLAAASPVDKANQVIGLSGAGRRVAMVGDGINDAAALAAAHVGIAMGTGTDIAKHAGDIVLLRSDPRAIADAIALSRLMMRRIRLGLGWAFLYNIVLIPLAAAGLVSPMLAAAAMALSSISVILNALSIRVLSPDPHKAL